MSLATHSESFTVKTYAYCTVLEVKVTTQTTDQTIEVILKTLQILPERRETRESSRVEGERPCGSKDCKIASSIRLPNTVWTDGRQRCCIMPLKDKVRQLLNRDVS